MSSPPLHQTTATATTATASCLRLFTRLPNLRKLTMTVQLPHKLDEYQVSMGPLEDAMMPNARTLSINIGHVSNGGCADGYHDECSEVFSFVCEGLPSEMKAHDISDLTPSFPSCQLNRKPWNTQVW